MYDANVVCWLLINLIACSNAAVVDPLATAEVSDEHLSWIRPGQFSWIGPEVTEAARNESGCESLPCKDLTEGFPVTNAGIWGSEDKPVVSPEVSKWASELAKLHMQAVVSKSTGPLRKGELEEAFRKMVTQTEPYQPADRLLHVKVIAGKVYIIGASDLDIRPSSNMMSYWSTGLLRGIIKILERSNMPDWEAIFTSAANSYDVIEPFKPGIPVFTHCAAGVDPSYGVAIPIPRPYALWRLHEKSPELHTVQEMQQILQGKIPMAVFRGALSGPSRISLFQLSQRNETKPYVDVGMTTVPFGAPCEYEAAWCEGQEGPPGWVQKYGLQRGEFLQPADQLKYRYVMIADGVGCPDRLSTHPEFNLASGSVAMWQRSNLSEFWFPNLKPWVHYIPIQENFTDVAELVSTYNNKLEDLARIALNAQAYVRTYHHAGAWLQYLRELLVLYATEFINYEIDIPPHAVQVVMTGEGGVVAE